MKQTNRQNKHLFSEKLLAEQRRMCMRTKKYPKTQASEQANQSYEYNNPNLHNILLIVDLYSSFIDLQSEREEAQRR